MFTNFCLRNYPPFSMKYILLGVLFFSINNVFWALFSKTENALSIIRKRSIYTSIIFSLIYYTQFGFTLDKINSIRAPALIITCSFGAAGLYFLVKGFKFGSIMLFSIYSLLSTILIGLYSFFIEQLFFTVNFTGCFVIIIGYCFFAFSRSNSEKSNFKGHLYFILAQLFFSITLFLEWNLLKEISTLEFVITQELFILIATSILLILNPKKNTGVEQKWYIYFVIAIPICLAVFFNTKGLQATNPLINAIINLSTPILTIVIGSYFAKEILQKKDIISFAVIAFGVFLLLYNKN